MGVREAVLERTTGPYLAVVLKLMASSFNRRPDLRRELYRRHNGTIEPFDSRYQFCTADGDTNLYLTIEGGRMRAGTGAVQEPDLVATFSDSAALRLFLSPFSRSDPLNLLLENRLSFEGNMSYLARLGHLTAVARNRRWRQTLDGTIGRVTWPNAAIPCWAHRGWRGDAITCAASGRRRSLSLTTLTSAATLSMISRGSRPCAPSSSALKGISAPNGRA